MPVILQILIGWFLLSALFGPLIAYSLFGLCEEPDGCARAS